LRKLELFVKDKSFPDPAPLHALYSIHFNLVDKADKYWYKFKNNHGLWKWKTKMILSIMRFFVMNVWVIFCSTTEYQELASFRENLAKALVEVVNTEAANKRRKRE
jgi:hypothetical protein